MEHESKTFREIIEEIDKRSKHRIMGDVVREMMQAIADEMDRRYPVDTDFYR